MKVAVLTLGCQVNECESRSVIAEMKALGAETTDEQAPADVYVVNTASVTAEADGKRGQLERQSPRLGTQADS